MAAYYLVSQLPSLDGVDEGVPLPITEERFLELCDRLLGRKARQALDGLTLCPSLYGEAGASSALIGAWNERERSLRVALARARAEKSGRTFDSADVTPSAQIVALVDSALAAESPLAAERILDGDRLAFLETLRPMDAFSEEFVLYYGLKLKILSRTRRFDKALGMAVYKSIYDAALGADENAEEG